MVKNLPLSYIELSSENVIHNIKQFRSIAKGDTKIAAVIKGNAYGHGQNEMAKILEPIVDYFQVNNIQELELLRKVSKKKTFVFGYVQHSDLPRLIKLGCILSVFSIAELKEVEKIAQKSKIKQEIHVPIDAHLGREGFLESELPAFFEELQKCKNIKITGIYAHFANIEDTADFSHAQKQIFKYDKAVKIAEEFGFNNLQTHMSATSGLLIYEKNKSIHPIVRIGIGTYGMWPSEHLKSLYANSKFKLKPVLSWKTKIVQIKTLPAGSTVGYGLTYVTKEEVKTAIIPQGYSDGLDRKLSNKGFVLIGGTRCDILGRVMMNMFVVDISHLPKVKIEDEVVIIGVQGKDAISAEEMASLVDTINYEITTRIGSLLPRVVI